MSEYTPEQLAEELNLSLWTHSYPEVIARCAVNLAYRANVCSATQYDYQQVLIREAERLAVNADLWIHEGPPAI